LHSLELLVTVLSLLGSVNIVEDTVDEYSLDSRPGLVTNDDVEVLGLVPVTVDGVRIGLLDFAVEMTRVNRSLVSGKGFLVDLLVTGGLSRFDVGNSERTGIGAPLSSLIIRKSATAEGAARVPASAGA